jgi:hypothetical protein
MNIDLTPYSPATPDAGLATPFAGEPQTLTLALAIGARLKADEQMDGIAHATDEEQALPASLRVSFAPADGQTSTITFW